VCGQKHDGVCKQTIKACLHCKATTHKTGDNNCPRRQLLQHKDTQRTKTIRRKTFAEMLKQFDPLSKMPGEDESRHLNEPFDSGFVRKRKSAESNEAGTSRISPPRKRPSVSGPMQCPPGFRNPNDKDNDEVWKFMNAIVNELELPPFIMQLIQKFLLPIVHQFITRFTNSLMDKFTSLST